MVKHLGNFELIWRFTDKRYCKLPLEDLREISFLENGIELWKKYVSNTHNHILKLTNYEEKETVRFKVNWNNELLGRQLIEFHCLVGKNNKIFFFWSPKCAVETKWNIFTKYWTDFCYPDDDNNVIIIPSLEYKIYFCEEIFVVKTNPPSYSMGPRS